MKTIQYVENGLGDRVPDPIRSTNGLSLFNANGDVSDASTGFKYAIDTMSFIKAEVIKQKFYEVAFGDFMPVQLGRGNYAEEIFTNVEFSNAANFASGILNTGSNTRLAGVDVATGKKSQKARLWGKQLTYNIAEIEQALQANNWDPIMAKEKSRKKNYDLGLQEVAFLGLTGFTTVTGLLNQADATVNTSVITEAISAMDATELPVFIGALISTYFTATASTAMPTHFVIPYTDFLALSMPFANSVGTFPVSKMTVLLQAFKEQTQNPNFKILPCAYCEAARNTAAGINKQCYALYRYDPESLLMEVPIAYTTTAVGTQNNFSFQNIAYSRFSGMGLFRNLELLYFRY